VCCDTSRRRGRYDGGTKFHETLVDFYQTKWHRITEKNYASCAAEINKMLLLHVCLLLNKSSNRPCMVQYYGNCLQVFFCIKLVKLMHSGEICMAVKPVAHLRGGRDPKNGGRRFLPNISKFLSDHTESQTIRQNLSEITTMPCSQLSTLKNVSEKVNNLVGLIML
jgi:hypothetical protein